jgi:hypothetical protein
MKNVLQAKSKFVALALKALPVLMGLSLNKIFLVDIFLNYAILIIRKTQREIENGCYGLQL